MLNEVTSNGSDNKQSHMVVNASMSVDGHRDTGTMEVKAQRKKSLDKDDGADDGSSVLGHLRDSADSSHVQAISILDRNRPLGSAALGGPATAHELEARQSWVRWTLEFLAAGGAVNTEGDSIETWKLLKEEMELLETSGAPLSHKARTALVSQGQAEKAIRQATMSAIRAEQHFMNELAQAKKDEHRDRINRELKEQGKSRRPSQQLTAEQAMEALLQRAAGEALDAEGSGGEASDQLGEMSRGGDIAEGSGGPGAPAWFTPKPQQGVLRRAKTVAKILRTRPTVVSASRYRRPGSSLFRSKTPSRPSGELGDAAAESSASTGGGGEGSQESPARASATTLEIV